MRHRSGPVVACVLACAVLLASCGSDAPGDQVPELAEQLSAVDDALASGSYLRAREHLEALVAATEEARAAGDLDDDDADRVLASAARLLTELPDSPGPDPETSPEPSPEPTPSESEEGEGGEESDEDEEDPGKHQGKGEDKGEDKGKEPKSEGSKGKGKGKD